MFSASRAFLVIFLALLQLIAPLVHAHAGEKIFAVISRDAGKLHIPGLEAYTSGDGHLMPDAGDMKYRVAKLDAPSDGLVVGVDAGIKQDQYDDVAGADHYCLPQNALVVKTPLLLIDSIDPRAPPHLLSACLFSPHSPRAPPVFCSACS